MDQAYYHFLFNHFPILGTLFGGCILGYGLLRKNKSLEDAGLVTLVIVSLLTFPASRTGEIAEEAVEHLPGFSEHLIHEHEELAEKAVLGMIVLGLICLTTLIVSKIKKNRFVAGRIVALIVAIGCFALMVFVGKTGGEIRHSEIRGEMPISPDNGEENKH